MDQQSQQGGRVGGRIGVSIRQTQHQMVPRGRVYPYPPTHELPSVPMPSGGMRSVPYSVDMSVRDVPISRPFWMRGLGPIIANASPRLQRTMLGECIYLLVEQVLELHAAAKVTGMFLELPQTEILSLIESPDILKAMVVEAMEVLSHAGWPGN